MKNKTLDIKGFRKRIQKDFNRTYFLCLIGWTIVCLLFSKQVNLAFGKLGGFLFSGDQDSLHVYLWVIIGSFVLYLFGRIAFIGRFLWGQFPVAKSMAPIAIWYFINVHEWVNPTISFVALPFSKNLNFLSLTYFFCIFDLLFMVIYYLMKVEPRSNNKSSFITDIAFDPEDKEPKDLLGFDSFAERIATEVKNISSSESVVFGINGEWGEGKTSMINLIRKKLKDEKYTVVDFHPWKTNSGKAMNQLFFDALKDGLKNKNVGINWKIDRYAEALLHLDKTGFGKMLWQLFAPSDSVEAQKKKLGESMKILDKNLVVVVDDLDRLAKNEIADVLKLMRDTANFPNLVFIAAYDRNYLDTAIKSEINDHKPENYMDKIVLWEAPIYKPQPRIYLDALKSLLRRHKNIIWEENINDLFHEHEGIFSKETSQGINLYELHTSLLQDLRSVKRFVNFLIFNYKTVISENKEEINAKVWFKDFYYLYMIRFFYAKYYERFQIAYHELYTWTNNGKIETSCDKYWPKIFSEPTDKLNNEADETKDVENVKAIISVLLISDHRNWPATRIVWYKNFLEYFHLGNHSDITMEAFAKMLEAEDFETFKNKIEILNTEKKILAQFNSGEIISALRIISEPNTAENDFFINYFQQLIWVYKIKDHLPPRLVYNEIHEYLPGRSNLLKADDIEIIQKGVLKFIRQQSLEEVVQPLITLLIYEYKESENQLNNLDYKYTFLTISDAISIAKDNFTRHVKNTTSITLETIRLYYYCYQKIDENDMFVLDDEVTQQMRKLADRYPKDFLKYLIIKYRKKDLGNNVHKLNSILMSLFKDLDELKLYINDKTFTKEEKMLVQIIIKLINHLEDKVLALSGVSFEELGLTDKEQYFLKDCLSFNDIKEIA
jgi:hypothetical protein